MLAGLNLDFLCIHPFRDGNGRVSRLLLLQACYILGFDVGRYIIIEAIRTQKTPFTLSAICDACPEVSREWIRKQLAMLKKQNLVTCQGHGVAAKWTYKGTTS